MKFKFSESKGQASKLLLVLAAVVLVAVIITFLIMKMAVKPPEPVTPGPTAIPLPVYEQTLGKIRFIFLGAIDRGSALKVSDIRNPQYASSIQKELTTGEKFIQVTIGAQNKGTENTEQNAWKMENIVDSEGRNYEPLQGYTVQPWLPVIDQCGEVLKPAFNPTSCTKIYEVSKQSTGLKIRVETGIGNKAVSDKFDVFLLDLIVK